MFRVCLASGAACLLSMLRLVRVCAGQDPHAPNTKQWQKARFNKNLLSTDRISKETCSQWNHHSGCWLHLLRKGKKQTNCTIPNDAYKKNSPRTRYLTHGGALSSSSPRFVPNHNVSQGHIQIVINPNAPMTNTKLIPNLHADRRDSSAVDSDIALIMS